LTMLPRHFRLILLCEALPEARAPQAAVDRGSSARHRRRVRRFPSGFFQADFRSGFFQADFRSGFSKADSSSRRPPRLSKRV